MIESLTYEVLSEIYRREMNSPSLTAVAPNLYVRMGALFEDVNVRYQNALKTNPESTETDRFFTIRKNVRKMNNDIISIRNYKVAKMAFNSAMGSKTTLDPLTPEEKRFFENMKAVISKHLAEVMY